MQAALTALLRRLDAIAAQPSTPFRFVALDADEAALLASLLRHRSSRHPVRRALVRNGSRNRSRSHS